jgi:translocation and assembly module TamB
MTKSKRASLARRLLLGALLFAGLVTLAVVTSPWWWASAARGILAGQGITFADFESLGYSRFALRDVRFENPSASATVARLEADSPLAWLAHATFSQPGPVILTTWQVTLHNPDRTPSATPFAIDGWPGLRSRLNETLATLQRWLPEARAGSGTVTFDKQTLSVASLDWFASEGKLHIDDIAWRGQTADADLRWLAADSQLSFSATTHDEQWGASLETNDNTVIGQLRLWKQPVDLRATFPARGWIPEQAELTATRLAVPGRAVGLGELYAALPTEARLVWKDALFTVELSAEGQPAENNPAPPLRLALAGQGDTESLRIERFDISFPGTSARLMAPIVIDRDAQIRSGASQFSLDSDLEKIPGVQNLRGKITGRVLVEPDSQGEPRLTAKLEASNVTAPGLDIKNAAFEAVHTGQLLTVKNARIAFADGSEADVQGAWNWRERTLSEGKLEGDIKPAAFARWLPQSLTFSRFTVSAQAEGHWPDLKHSGKLAVTEATVGTPKSVSATAEWSGTGPTAEDASAEIKTGNSAAVLKGRVTLTETTIDSLALTLPDAPALTLARPARILWQPSLSIETLDLTGGDTRVSFAWSTLAGRAAKIDLVNIASSWLRDFLPSTWPRWQLDSGALEGRWPEGPFEGTTKVLGQVEIAPDKNARIELTAQARSTGVLIEQLLVSDENGSVLTARGGVPLIITPATAPFWKLDPAGRWSLTADTTPDSPFWTAQAEASGIKLRAPRLTARIDGSVEKPDASIELQAEEIAFDRHRLPPLSKLDARLVLDAGRIDLEKLSVLIAGQAATASGHSRINAEQWAAILHDPRQLWQGDAEATLSLPRIEISALSGFLPQAFAPTGTLSGDMTVRASGEIAGTLKLHDASTHPISPFGSFNQISGDILFSGRKAEVKSLSALASGQAVKAAGTVEFPADAPLKVDLTLAGENLPLARQTGLLIRGDLNLQVKSSADGRTTLGGEVRLHDSLFLRDVRSLIPTRGGSPSSRPPYFSVTAEPFRDWQLALTVGGDRFITLRTPLFSGVVSGRFQLSGTLFEPVAIGQATFDEGVVRLPFAALRLTNGSVRLTQADPYSPQIAINAASRTLGYDVRMELSGAVSDPSLEFSSSPPLSSEQILLMVMAGETPRSDISYSATQRATGIGVYLGKSLLSGVFGDPTAAERLTISSGENVTEGGKETYNVEYKLDNRWSLIGERDEFDDYNAGVKLRVFTSKKKKTDVAPR